MFKIGDKVMTRTPDINFIHNGDIGEIVAVYDESEFGVKYPQDDFRYYVDKKYLEQAFPVGKTPDDAIFSINEKWYSVLIPISGESVWGNGKYKGCKEWENEFGRFLAHFPLFTEIIADSLLRTVLSENPKWLAWLLNKGYLGEIKTKQKKFIDGWINIFATPNNSKRDPIESKAIAMASYSVYETEEDANNNSGHKCERLGGKAVHIHHEWEE